MMIRLLIETQINPAQITDIAELLAHPPVVRVQVASGDAGADGYGFAGRLVGAQQVFAGGAG